MCIVQFCNSKSLNHRQSLSKNGKCFVRSENGTFSKDFPAVFITLLVLCYCSCVLLWLQVLGASFKTINSFTGSCWWCFFPAFCLYLCVLVWVSLLYLTMTFPIESPESLLGKPYVQHPARNPRAVLQGEFTTPPRLPSGSWSWLIHKGCAQFLYHWRYLSEIL